MDFSIDYEEIRFNMDQTEERKKHHSSINDATTYKSYEIGICYTSISIKPLFNRKINLQRIHKLAQPLNLI